MALRKPVKQRIALLNAAAIAAALLIVLAGGYRAINSSANQPTLDGTGLPEGEEPDRRAEAAYTPVEKAIENREPTNHVHGAQGYIALVIDDFGNYLESPEVQAVLDFSVPVTIGVIPGRMASTKIAMAAADHGHEVIVHIPMQPVGMRDDVPYDVVHTEMPDSTVIAYLEDAAGNVPGAAGLSNHQGSAACQDAALMDLIASWCSQRGWYALDSMTHPQTVLWQRFEQAGVPVLKRDLFLDHYDDEVQIEKALQEALLLTKKRNLPVILVGHPRKNTVNVLREKIPDLRKEGIQFIRLSECLSELEEISSQ